MKKELKYLTAGLLIGTTLTGVTYATVGTKAIEAYYNNIKIYKDNVLFETKDVTGKVIEPFIYEGTTYLPVRGVANMAGMDVTWDGATQSVYLWDKIHADDTYLLDVCPPYETSQYCNLYTTANGNSFEMGGQKYTNGIAIGVHGWYSLFNLNSKYSEIECTIGHATNNDVEKTVYFYVDGKLAKSVTLEPDAMPRKVSVPLNYGLQLKIVSEKNDRTGYTGIGNITVK